MRELERGHERLVLALRGVVVSSYAGGKSGEQESRMGTRGVVVGTGQIGGGRIVGDEVCGYGSF